MAIGFGFYTDDAPTIKDNKALRQENITRILFTNKGERLNEPRFGSNLLKYLFNFENSIREDIESEVINSLRRYQSDLQVINIEIEKKDDKININIILLDTTTEEVIEFNTNIEVEG